MKKQFTYIAAAFFFSGMVSAQKIDINAMPKAGPTPTINIAKPKSFQMNNGLTVMVVENNKLPRVNMSLSMDRPPYYEGDVVGVSDIMAEQFENGTQNMSKDAFNKRVDYLGASLNFSSSGASANTLSKYFPEVLGLMADAIVNPKFDAKEVEDSKERAIEGIKSQEKNASAIADRVENALIYGKNTARGEFETVESISKIKLADVQNTYKKYYTPNNAYLVVVGDVKFDQVKNQIEKAFAGWKKSDTTVPVPAPAANVTTTEVNIVDVPSAVQSIVNIGNVNNLQMKNPDYFAATLANYILGGGGEARLFMNLREKNGFTYGAYSNMSASKYSPSFSANASVRNEVTDKAVTEFMNELNTISTVKPEELDNAKAKLKGSFIMSLEKPETLARFAVSQKVQELPDHFYTDYLKSIDKVTAADITKAVKTYILPNQSRIFIAGKASEISEGVEKLGYPVKYFDSYANPVSKPTVQKADAGVTAGTVGEKYINAIGGAAAVEKVTSIKTNAYAKIQGMDIDMTMIQAKGGKMMQDIKMMDKTMQKVVFDGKDGYIETQGQQIPLPEDEKKKMLKDTELFPEVLYAKSADYKLSGIEKFNNEDCYVIKGEGETSYYSVKTGLKTGDVKDGSSTTYGDYKDVSGVKLPFTISQDMGGMDVQFRVRSYQINKAKDSDFK